MQFYFELSPTNLPTEIERSFYETNAPTPPSRITVFAFRISRDRICRNTPRRNSSRPHALRNGKCPPPRRRHSTRLEILIRLESAPFSMALCNQNSKSSDISHETARGKHLPLF